jgi:hypothetical protein
MKKIKRLIVIGFGIFLIMLLSMWSAAAIYYSNLPWHFLRLVSAAAFLLLTISFLIFIKPFYKAVFVFLSLFAVILVWWFLIPASNNRQWQQDVAVLPYARIDGNQVIVHNIRNNAYRSETDYIPAYYDKAFDLSKLQGAELFICFWGPKLIAHTILSFHFDDGQYLCVSIETRKEVGEEYSSVKGFFKQYELIYVVGDEKDLIRLRTNFRKEDVYLYRLNISPLIVREVFLDYLKTINQINEKPQWYNALTQNCTTAIRGHTVPYVHGKLNWKMIANGYLDSLLYERKVINTGLPFEQIKAKCLINEKALKAGDNADFSSIIRDGLPKPN